jgi:hypothetical protein
VVECLERVLELNPFSEKARCGLTEARRRIGQERGRTAS